MVFKNIAISGRIAVGSSSLAKALSLRLKWQLRDASQIFRDISMHSGFDLEKDPQKYGVEIDLAVDTETRDILMTKQVVVVSKLAGFLSRDIGNSLRILVSCPIEERVNRYAKDRGYSIIKSSQLIESREKSDQEKWEKLYGKHDFFDSKIFHLVIDSGKLNVEEEIDLVLRHLNLTQNLC